MVDPSLARGLFPRSEVRAVSRVGATKIAQRSWAWLLPAMAAAWRRVDLSDYEVVITSAHACVNAVQPPADVPVISYCHTPMRYAWEWESELGRIPAPLRFAWPVVARWLQRADRRRADNVTTFIANSSHVAQRIQNHYGKEATVVYPPVDTRFWTPGDGERENFFLAAGRLVAYKRVDLVVEAATACGARLVVAGNGAETQRLKRLAGPSVTFEEDPTNERFRDLYRRSKALVFAGVEDFGMTLVEAQACGAPVLALARGGALESVIDGRTGVLFHEQTPAALAAVMSGFEPSEAMSTAAVANAARFDRSHFTSGFLRAVRRTLEGA